MICQYNGEWTKASWVTYDFILNNPHHRIMLSIGSEMTTFPCIFFPIWVWSSNSCMLHFTESSKTIQICQQDGCMAIQGHFSYELPFPFTANAIPDIKKGQCKVSSGTETLTFAIWKGHLSSHSPHLCVFFLFHRAMNTHLFALRNM